VVELSVPRLLAIEGPVAGQPPADAVELVGDGRPIDVAQQRPVLVVGGPGSVPVPRVLGGGVVPIPGLLGGG
jgi:hypothetical protein